MKNFNLRSFVQKTPEQDFFFKKSDTVTFKSQMTPCNLRENIAKSKGVEQNLTRLEKNLTFDCFCQNFFSGKDTHNWYSFFLYRVGYVIGLLSIGLENSPSIWVVTFSRGWYAHIYVKIQPENTLHLGWWWYQM